MMKSLLSSGKTFETLMSSLEKLVAAELKGMYKTSIFMHGKEALINFNWEMIWLELMKHCPVLMRMISIMLLDTNDRKPTNKALICFIAAMVLKKRNRSLCLIQSAISLLLYGHGTSKQVQLTYLNVGLNGCKVIPFVWIGVQLSAATNGLLVLWRHFPTTGLFDKRF